MDSAGLAASAGAAGAAGAAAGAAAAAQRPRWAQVRHTLERPGIALLVLVFFLATFSFACFETTLGLLVSLNFGLKFETIKGVVHVYDDKVVYLYTFCGLVGALVQGGPLGRAVKKLAAFGTHSVVRISRRRRPAQFFSRCANRTDEIRDGVAPEIPGSDQRRHGNVGLRSRTFSILASLPAAGA